ncbi:GTPase IMAP family member 7 [Fundulus heteroclitus]|uniref:GTPase IMAP family member 7 n=1 Tax=Fundulus heteroclitus TaxID=8078 RepID=UPI00165A6D7A|nr:GTPase IMAP family member 7 [Fundulus heteroclitus]
MSSAEAETRTEDLELRVLLVGSAAADKTLVMDRIQKCSESESSEASAKRLKPQAPKVRLEGRDLVLFDTPGLCSSAMTDDDVIKEIKTCVSRSARHVFLFVLQIDRFTAAKRRMVETVKSSFGEEVTKSMVLVFQGSVPEHERRPIEEAIAEVKALREFDEQCGQRHVVFYTGEEDAPEVRKLKLHIDGIVKESEGKCYTHEMMLLAESAEQTTTDLL